MFSTTVKPKIAFKYRVTRGFGEPKEMVVKKIANIPDGTIFDVEDCTHLIVTGNIGNNVTIPKIHDLILEVHGSIGHTVSMESFNGSIAVEGNIDHHVSIQFDYGEIAVAGNVGDNVSFQFKRFGEITVQGNVGHHAAFKSNHLDDITVHGNVGHHATFESGKNITVHGNVDHHAAFKTTMGIFSVGGVLGKPESLINENIEEGIILAGKRTNLVTIPCYNYSHLIRTDLPSLLGLAMVAGSLNAASLAPLSIKKGPALTTPFASLHTPEINSDLRDYLNSFTASEKPFTKTFERWNMDASEYSCACPITLKVPNIPVKLGDAIFDYQSLVDLPIQVDGRRINPISNSPFHLNQIEPASTIKASIQEIIRNKEASFNAGLSL